MYMPAPSGKDIYIRKIPLAHVITYTYITAIPWTGVVCLICTPEARGQQVRGLRVYISSKPQVDMVLLKCALATPSGMQKAALALCTQREWNNILWQMALTVKLERKPYFKSYRP